MARREKRRIGKILLLTIIFLNDKNKLCKWCRKSLYSKGFSTYFCSIRYRKNKCSFELKKYIIKKINEGIY